MNVSSDKEKLIYPYVKVKGVYYPIISVKFNYLGNETEIKTGIIDTGSDTILIKHSTARHIGIEINEWKNSDAPSGSFKTGKVKVTFMILHNEEIKKSEKIEIRVSEKEKFPRLPLIGKKPLFDWYNIYLDNVNKRCELIPK